MRRRIYLLSEQKKEGFPSLYTAKEFHFPPLPSAAAAIDVVLYIKLDLGLVYKTFSFLFASLDGAVSSCCSLVHTYDDGWFWQWLVQRCGVIVS